MKSEEAKNILHLCRPQGLEDLNDPLIAEAFEALEQDSELSIWFEEQQTLDAEICAELNRITPSPELKASILSGMQNRIEQTGGASKDIRETTKLPNRRTESSSTSENRRSAILWFRPWMGIAAVFLFVSALLVLSRRGPPRQMIADDGLPANELTASLPATAEEIPAIIQFLSQQLADFNGSKFEKRSEQVNELQSYLAVAGIPSPAEIPHYLEAAPTIGCVTFDYGDAQLSMICFRKEKVYHLFTINRNDLGETDLSDYPSADAKVFEHQKKAFRMWSEGENVYILCTKGTMPEFI